MCAESTLQNDQDPEEKDCSVGTTQSAMEEVYNKLYPTYADMPQEDFEYCMHCNEVPDHFFQVLEECIQSTQTQVHRPDSILKTGHENVEIDRLDQPENPTVMLYSCMYFK